MLRYRSWNLIVPTILARRRAPPPGRARSRRPHRLVRPRRRDARLHAVGGQPADPDARAHRRRAAARAAGRPARGLASPRPARCCCATPRRSSRGCTPRRRTWTALAQGQAGASAIGTFQSVGAKVLPEHDAPLPRDVAARRPRAARVDVRRRPARGSSSAGSSTSRSRCCRSLDGPFESLELLRDPYVLVVPADHELARPRPREPRRARRPDADRQPRLPHHRARRERAGAARRRGRGRVPLGRQRHRAGPRRAPASAPRSCRCSRSTRTTSASACSRSSRRSRTAASRSRGTVTATAPPRRAPSSSSPPRSARSVRLELAQPV